MHVVKTFKTPQSKWRGFFVFLCLCTLSGRSATLSPTDSLSLNVSGGAALTTLHGAGSKASENGLLICLIDHSISDRVHALCAIRGSRSGNRAFIEEAALKWSLGRNEAEAGFVSNRYGFGTLYRPFSIFIFLFDKPVLWDAYGFGFTYKRSIGTSASVTAGSSINTRENGQAHVLLSMNKALLSLGILGGVQTYSMDDQDNSIATGLDATLRWDCLQIHGIAKYTDYLGFGHSSNPTMVPGKSFTGLLELSWMLTHTLNARAISYILKLQKRYDHQFLFEGLEASWMFARYFGLGSGCEWQKDDDVISLMPRCFLKAVPSADHASLEVSFQPTITHSKIISYRFSGEIWMRL
jgi:hypothetical protein